MASRPYHKSFTLTNSSAELSTGISALETLQISNAFVVNTSASAITVNLNSAYDGGTAATGNIVEVDKAIDAKATVGSALTGAVLNTGEKLYGYASTTGVAVLHVHGIVSAHSARTYA